MKLLIFFLLLCFTHIFLLNYAFSCQNDIVLFRRALSCQTNNTVGIKMSEITPMAFPNNKTNFGLYYRYTCWKCFSKRTFHSIWMKCFSAKYCSTAFSVMEILLNINQVSLFDLLSRHLRRNIVENSLYKYIFICYINKNLLNLSPNFFKSYFWSFF